MQHTKETKEFASILVSLAHRRSYRDIFIDLLDLAIYPLVISDQANLARNPLSEYLPDEQQKIRQLLYLLGECMFDYTDALGDLFMEHLSFGKNGQFFTPQPICDMMAQMTIDAAQCTRETSIADCACGSGRTLLAAAKIFRDALFYGSDIDLTCVKMTVINMAFNSLRGEVHWMDALSLNHHGSYRIDVEPFTKLPYIIILPADKSQGVTAIKAVAAAMPAHQKQQVIQQTLF